MKFSVLICTYNRPELFRKTMESLLTNSDEKPDEIVVVNGGDALTDRLVQSFIIACDDVKINHIKTANKSCAASRNVGLPFCQGDIVAITDDDAEVFPNWVRLMKEAHREHPEAGAVGGPVLGTNTSSLVGKVADLITFPDLSQAQYVRTIPTVNISYKREVVDGVGLMDEAFFCGGEDVDYNWRVQQLGYKVYFDPRIKVYHKHRPTLKGFLNQHYRYGRGYYLVRRKWQEMYCVYPHHFRRLKDGMKAANFIAGLFYQPFKSSQSVSPLKTRVALIPLVFLAEVAWKSGMIRQACRDSKS